MKVAGIDYSMTSPAITIYDSDKDEYTFHFYTANEKLYWSHPFYGTLHKEWTTQEERFDQIGDWALGVVHDCDHIFIEGYAFSAKGLVFNIGENTGVLKHKLMKAGLKYETIGPTELKKWAAGKGNAQKHHMETAFVIDTNIQVRECIGQPEVTKKGKLVETPSSDIIDSYFIAKMGFTLLNT